MLSNFINDFKQSKYYKQIFTENKSKTILGIYVVGSTCMNLDDDDSDYDITILTLDGNYVDTLDEFNLRYKGKKVHWWYIPISMIFNLQSELHIMTPLQLRYIKPEFIIYENSEYKQLLDTLFSYKYEISKLAIYKFFEEHDYAIQEVISENTILPKWYFYKYFYHLCNATYYLRNEEVDSVFLKELKRIYCKQISEKTKSLAVECLANGKNYINEHPIDYQKELSKLYEKIIHFKVK